MTTLAEVTARADRIVADCAVAILAILNDLTAETRYVAAVFDGTDPEAVEIYRELGLGAAVDPGSFAVLDVLQGPLDAALARRRYVAIDELPGYEPGTVLLYVLTRGAVVARRFEKGAEPVAKLREVRRTRDVEIRSRLRVEGPTALDVLAQWAAPVLRRLWRDNQGRIALIARASHGAKVGYIERDVAVRVLREAGVHAPPQDRAFYQWAVEQIEAAPKPDSHPCIVEGFGRMELVWIGAQGLTAAAAHRWSERDEDRLHEWIVACRDRKRALGLLEKSLDQLGESSSVCVPLAELVALVRTAWEDFAAIQRQIRVVGAAGDSIASKPAGARLRGILMALAQATIERERGGAVNARGGSG